MEAPISSSLGAMGQLLMIKLDSLLARDGSRLPRLLKSRIENLKMDLLEDVVIPLVELSEEKAPDLTAKYWMTEVREMSYDIEDSIDEMTLPAHVNASGATRSGAVSLRFRVRRAKNPKIPRLPKKLNWSMRIAKLRTDLVWEAIDRHDRYLRKDVFVFSAQLPVPAQDGEQAKATNLDLVGVSNPDHQNPTRYGESFNLVGMDESRIELTNWIRCEEKQSLEVISIVGPGGIGKTSVAKELYREHGEQFICRAFVQASRKPSIRKLLWDIFAQIQRHQLPTRACNVQTLIDNIRGHLQDKRYFIVIDDVWQTTVWDIVSSAFPESNNCSRIIITTEMEDVALECGGYKPDYIFKMKPLGDVDSTKLFMNIFGSECQQSQKELDKALYEIAKKNGGSPFAITILAGLARVSAIQQTKLGIWSHIQNFLHTTLTCFGPEEMMKEILHFCYDNLPQHLKTCLLYLSMYPEGYIISKADLVQQWIAEGFICTTQGKDKEEIAESYFNELINIRLIHPNRIKYIDGVMSCTVHHMVLDMIKCKSKEVNFTTVTDYPRINAGLSTKVRRLSLQFSSTKHASNPATVTMPHVRSITYFGLLECLPLVASFKFKIIRVLVIEIWGEHDGWTTLDFTRISAFLHLRYLKITSDVRVQLPAQMVGLQHLESLTVDARVCSVPSDIIRLPRLCHLRIKDDINLPDRIGSIISLRTLQYFDLAQNSVKNVQSLGELSNLRDLHLTCSSTNCAEHLNRNHNALSSSLGNLRGLCSLTLAPGASGGRSIPLEGSIIISCVPVFIQRLKLLPPICIFSRIPERMAGLHKLRVLKIAVTELLRNDISHLSELPALTVLSLHLRVARVGTVIIERGSFPALRYFKFRSSVLSMAFRAGAMPSLQILKVGFKAQTENQYGRMLGGIEHLLSLQEITGEIAIASNTGESDWTAAQRAFQNAIEYSSRKWNAVTERQRFPRVHVKLVDWMVAEEAFARHEGGSAALGTTTNRDPAVCDNLPFPLDLLPKVISFTSPLDACRCFAVCTAFRAAASCDLVWDRFIPPDYRSILSRATDPVDLNFASTKKELFTNLSEQRILIDEGNMSFWLERTTGSKSYMLSARSLNITWGNTPSYWRWITLPDSRFEEVAELVDVCWLDITATIDCRKLSPNTRYTACLVFNLTDRSYGLDSPTQKACITIAGAVSSRHTVSMSPRAPQQRSRAGFGPHYWMQHHSNSKDEDEDQDDEDEETQQAGFGPHYWMQHHSHWEDEDEDQDNEDEETQQAGFDPHYWMQHHSHWEDEDEDQDDEDKETQQTEDEQQDDVEVEEDEDEEDDIEVEEDENYEDDEDSIEIEVEEEEEDDYDNENEEQGEEKDNNEKGGEEKAPPLQDSHEHDETEEVVRYPRARDDGWMEVELGKFYVENLDDGAVGIRLKEHDNLNWKSGLIVEGLEVRPVIGSDKRATAS